MNTLRNNVQLIGNVGQEPTITNLESGKKVARLSLVTNEHYKNSQGEKKTDTNWHTLVAWGTLLKSLKSMCPKVKKLLSAEN